MPIPANRVKDLCFVHVHTNAPGAAEPGYAKRVLQTIYKQPVPTSAKVLCTRGAPQNQQFFGSSLKRAGEERQLNFLDKASFSVHLEEFTDGQGARGQVCAVIAKQVAGPLAVKCACGRMVNPGPKARCPYCGRAVVAGEGAGEDELQIVGETEATVPAVPGLDGGPGEAPLASSDLGARMAARARGGALTGSWVQNNMKVVVGGGAVVLIALVWFLFFRGKGISTAWKETFQTCKWELCIKELEKQVASGAVAERQEVEFRLAQAKLERKAQSVTQPAGSGPEIGLLQTQLLSGGGAETIFLNMRVQSSLATPVDIEPRHFYLLYRPATETFMISFAELIEEVPWSKTTLGPKERLRCSIYVPVPGKSIDVMYLVYNNGEYYRRTLVGQNFSPVSSKSFIQAPEWKATGAETAGEPIVHDPGPKPPPTDGETGTPITPDQPTGPPQPPQASLPMAPGNALDLKGWRIEVGGNYPATMIQNTLCAGVGMEYLIVEIKLFPQSDAAAQWPIGSNDFKLWHGTGRTHDSVGALYSSYQSPVGPRPIFAEWYQMKCGEASEKVGTALDSDFATFADRYERSIPQGQEGVMEVVFPLVAPCQPPEYRVVVSFGDKPAEPPSAPPGHVLGPGWTHRYLDCKTDAIPLGDGRSIVTKFATEDWVVKVVEPMPVEGMYTERTTLGARGMTVRVSLAVTPWAFRSSSAAAPPLETERFGLRSPKGGEWKAIGWVVDQGAGEEVVDKVTIVGSDTVGEASISVQADGAVVRVGQGGVARLIVIVEGVKEEGQLSDYMLVHGLKTME